VRSDQLSYSPIASLLYHPILKRANQLGCVFSFAEGL
jgi:hypothetical protein